jgi:FlgN protein
VSPEVLVSPANGVASIDAFTLADALDAECRLLGDLRSVLEKQRDGVARDDAEAVDDSVIAAHRVMRTLDEARKRRRTVVGILSADEDTPLTDLDAALGSLMTPQLQIARARLHDEAQRVAREIEVNRRILRAAMEHGDRFMKAICGGPPAPSSYESSARPGQPASRSGSLINESV